MFDYTDYIDYEVSGYKVSWVRPFCGKSVKRSRKFDTEDDAVDFIQEHRSDWESYKLEQIRTAIIDF